MPSTATQHPVLSWADTLDPAAAQQSYELIVTATAGYWTSGLVYGPVSQVQLPWLVAGQPTTASLTVTDTTGAVAEASAVWTPQPATVPAAPTVTTTVSPVSAAPQVLVTVNGAGGVVGDIQRSPDGGTTWRSIPGAPGTPLGSAVADLLMPPGVPVLYRGCVQTTDNTARSPWGTSAPVTVTSNRWWVVNPVTGQATPVCLQRSTLDQVLSARQEVLAQLGVSAPSVLTDARSAAAVTFRFTFIDALTAGMPLYGYAPWAVFFEMVAPPDGSSPTLLVQSATTGEQWWVVFGDLSPSTDLVAARSGVIVRQVTAAAQVVAPLVVAADAVLGPPPVGVGGSTYDSATYDQGVYA